MDCDVAIIGYGACRRHRRGLLGGQGLTVAVVERMAGVYDKPRAITADTKSCAVCSSPDRHGAGAHVRRIPGTRYSSWTQHIKRRRPSLPPLSSSYLQPQTTIVKLFYYLLSYLFTSHTYHHSPSHYTILPISPIHSHTFHSNSLSPVPALTSLVLCVCVHIPRDRYIDIFCVVSYRDSRRYITLAYPSNYSIFPLLPYNLFTSLPNSLHPIYNPPIH
jgi:hypothetical protein